MLNVYFSNVLIFEKKTSNSIDRKKLKEHDLVKKGNEKGEGSVERERPLTESNTARNYIFNNFIHLPVDVNLSKEINYILGVKWIARNFGIS